MHIDIHHDHRNVEYCTNNCPANDVNLNHVYVDPDDHPEYLFVRCVDLDNLRAAANFHQLNDAAQALLNNAVLDVDDDSTQPADDSALWRLLHQYLLVHGEPGPDNVALRDAIAARYRPQ